MASGAIFGLVGAALVFGIRRGGVYGGSIKKLMLRWTIYLLVIGFLFGGMIDNWAHVGGLLTGAAFAGVISAQPPRGDGTAYAWRIASLLCVALVIVSFLFAGARGMESLEFIRGMR